MDLAERGPARVQEAMRLAMRSTSRRGYEVAASSSCSSL